ncbi:MAG TPA: restriction endonuclease subunit S [Rubrivivax sp.]|nr:restriction endonuclease subunit S [Rubrivivax sp.]
MAGLPASWSFAPLSGLGSWVGGGTPSKSESAYWTCRADGGVPWVSPKDMKSFGIYGAADHITEAAVAASATTKVAPGSVFVVTRSGILRHTLPVAVSHVWVAINQDLKALTPHHGFCARYLAYALKANEQPILHDCVKDGTTVQSINFDALKRLSIPLAPANEQQRIADTLDELFSDLDAAVAALERVRAKLKLYRASVLKAAVEGDLTKDWRTQHADAELAEQLLQRILAERRRRWEEDQLAKYKAKGTAPPAGWKAKYQESGVPASKQRPRLPPTWCSATVGQLGEVGTGATPNRGMKALYYEGGSIPWVTSSCVNAPIVRDPSEFVTAAAMRECNLTLYPAGTLLVAMYGEGKTRGKCAELAIESATNQALAAIQRLGALGPYVKLFLHKHYQDLRGVASGGVQPNLNLERVREIEIPLPPLAEQEAIVEVVEDQLSVIDHLEADLDAKLRSAQALRQAILRRAFAGKLVPQDPNDEPAAELLKRIAAERAVSARLRPAVKRRGAKAKAKAKAA